MRIFWLFAIVLTFFSMPVLAQSSGKTVPTVPGPLQALADKGAQLRYLGTEHGMDGWIAIYKGQEQYYYITGDKKAFVTGLMFEEDGRPVTIEQVQRLQQQSGDVLDLMAESPVTSEDTATAVPKDVSSALKNQSPGERMFADVENSNWIRLGNASAPVIYAFIDPRCPHCHEFISEAKSDYLDKGLFQIRMIPVGFLEGSLPQAAFLLAAPDAQDRFFRQLAGEKDAIPTKSDISTQAVQKNMALMQAWKFNVTPLITYRARDGEVKIIRGKPKDLQALTSDLPSSATP